MPVKPVRIGFTGPAGSGKSTIARIINHSARHYAFDNPTPSPFKRFSVINHISFALPLKLGLEAMGVVKGDPFYRTAAQRVGTEVFRAYDENWWVNQLLYRTPSVDEPTLFFIDDVRFLNEAEVCDLLFYIDAEDVRREHGLKGRERDHSSDLGSYFERGFVVDLDTFFNIIHVHRVYPKAPSPPVHGGDC